MTTLLLTPSQFQQGDTLSIRPDYSLTVSASAAERHDHTVWAHDQYGMPVIFFPTDTRTFTIQRQETQNG